MAKHKKKSSKHTHGTHESSEHITHDTKKESSAARKPRMWVWVAVFLVVVLGVFAFVAISHQPQSTQGTSSKTTPTSMASLEKVDTNLYVMSQCPYGTQAVDTIAGVKDKLGDAVNLNINYILYPASQFAGKEAQYCLDGLCSMHGVNEVKGDIVQLCAMKYNPDDYLKMITCQNQDASSIPDNWEQCASAAGLNVDKIKACYEGDEGKQLLEQSAAKSDEAKATGSPTIYINDSQYTGSRSENDFMRAICSAYQDDEKPSACDAVPEPAKVNVIILNDKRCDKCDMTQLKAQLKAVFPGMVETDYDYSSAEGKKLFDDTGVGVLPAVLFDDTVQNDENYAKVSQYLEQKGSYYSLRIGASFDPTAEICDNGIDDTGNGKVDCADETCADTLECREEIKNNLQVFVMSDCPYGKLALKALKSIADNFGSAITYDVHYIASETSTGFTSLHGTYEADEDIVQLCVKKYSPAAWLDYLYCRSDNGVKGNDWKDCAQETGVDIDKVETCSQGDEGKGLLREDIKIAQGLGIGASPTWLANNKYEFGGIDAETVKQSFCQYNPDTAGCENDLTSENASSVPSGSCG